MARQTAAQKAEIEALKKLCACPMKGKKDLGSIANEDMRHIHIFYCQQHSTIMKHSIKNGVAIK